ncbi:MAG: mechanosensitive ion channel [Planctomycetaceae bacterium]|nr:mechanosensitive ion channel [Planctomycetaceae bacterium]
MKTCKITLNRAAKVTFAIWLLTFGLSALVAAQGKGDAATDAEIVDAADGATDEEALQAPEVVDVDPLAEDAAIANRLTAILNATEWFHEPEVRVEEGVVFLTGRTTRPESKEWAGQLSKNTQDVVAVVNRIRVVEGPWWDLTPAWNELRTLGRDAVLGMPLFIVGLVLLLFTWYAARLSVSVAHRVFESRMDNRLLRQVAARAVAIPVFLLGLYLVLRISGLTQMAATVVGGTGLIGLVIGIAFRDIAENFLASILISTQRPFAIGDLIKIEDQKGFVQSVTTRGTLLMTLDGNHVQIPNATVYKATIQNFTANPKIRQDFTVGVGYDDSLAAAQETALSVLREHPTVLDDPEPWVLVEQLGAATVNLRVYFWIDGNKHSVLKVRSAIVRQVKGAFDQAGISMPDEAREVIFPNDVPVRMLSDDTASGIGLPRSTTGPPEHVSRKAETDEVSTPAEGGLASEADEIREQARQSRTPDEGSNLLEETSAS